MFSGWRKVGAHPDARWVRADAPALPFAGAFDLAVSFGAFGHFLPAERPALFAGVHRALRPGGLLAFPVAAAPPATSRRYWALLGFDLVIGVHNAIRVLTAGLVYFPPTDEIGICRALVGYARDWHEPAV